MVAQFFSSKIESKGWFLLRWGIVFVYFMGALAASRPEMVTFIKELTPFMLALSALAVVVVDGQWWCGRYLFFVLFAATMGMVVEWVGVWTGWPFGRYSYGGTLGVSVAGVPLLMALNWPMLLLESAACVAFFKRLRRLPPLVAPAASATLMTCLDVLLEPVAMEHDYWQWAAGSPPLQNYMAWAALAFLLQLFFWYSRLQVGMRLSVALFFAKGVYFFFIILL